jgi:uncharacterized protein (UPF0332 family)
VTPLELLDKAERALASARLLLDAGDVDGACNRAYYAMFDAARARLLASGFADVETIKTHSGLITAFSLHLVKAGAVSIDLGKSLNRIADIRLIADYTADEVSQLDAADAVSQAVVFVETMRKAIKDGA